ncbi:MAG: hypothetical protein J6Y02_16515 [Pseudobutyrivibrio sp.]|nr:hypothetical protein [Pseudobutyrivibrio sp.]
MFEWNFGDKILMDEGGLKYLADHAMPLVLTKEVEEDQVELTFYSQYLYDYLPDDNERRTLMALGYCNVFDVHIYTSDIEVFPIDIEKSDYSIAMTLIFPTTHDPATIKLVLLCNDKYEEGLNNITGNTYSFNTNLDRNQTEDGYETRTVSYYGDDWSQAVYDRSDELEIDGNYLPINNIDVSNSEVFELTDLSLYIQTNYMGGDYWPITEPTTSLVSYTNRSNPLVFYESFIDDVTISLYFDFYDSNNTLIRTVERASILTRGKFNYYVNNQLAESSFEDMPISFKQISIPANAKKLSVSICYNNITYMDNIPYNSYINSYAEQIYVDYKFKLAERESENLHTIKSQPYVIRFYDSDHDNVYDSYETDVNGVTVNNRNYKLVGSDDVYYYVSNEDHQIASIHLETVESLIKSNYVKPYTEQDDVAPTSPCKYYVKSDGTNGDPHGYYESFIDVPSWSISLDGHVPSSNPGGVGTWRNIGYISYSNGTLIYSTSDVYMGYMENTPIIGDHRGYLVRDGFKQRFPDGLNLVTASNINLDTYDNFRFSIGAYGTGFYGWDRIPYNSTITDVLNSFDIGCKVMITNKEDE